MFIILLFACAVLSSLLVFPLWFFATSFQGAYTIVTLIILVALFAFLLFRQVKKHGVFSAFRLFVKLFIILAGVSSSFYLVLTGRRLIALLTFAFALALYLLSSKILNSRVSELASENAK